MVQFLMARNRKQANEAQFLLERSGFEIMDQRFRLELVV